MDSRNLFWLTNILRDAILRDFRVSSVSFIYVRLDFNNSFVLKILLESLRLLRVLVSPYIMRMSFFFESDATENSMLVNTTLLWVS